MNVLNLAKRMSKRGWPVTIYGPSDSTLAKQAQDAGIKVSHIKSSFKFGDLRNSNRLARSLEADGIVYLINNTNHDIFLSVLAKRFANTPIKLLYYQHMQLGIEKRDWFHSWLYSNLDCWLAPLPGFIDSLKSKTKLDLQKAHIIPFGIDIETFTKNLPHKQQARKALQLPPDAKIVGVIGRLDPKKGQHTLIQALAKLKEQFTNLHILILGDKTHGEAENYQERLHQLVVDFNLGDRVHFREHRADVQTAYAALDIFTLTSESETYGMVTLEAMASGIPVIGTNAGGTKELMDNQATGLLYQYEDATALADCIKSLLKNETLATALSQEAQNKVEQNFSYQSQCQKLEEVLSNFA